MADKPKLRELAGYHEVSSSLCTPGVRTVILTTLRDSDGFQREVIPVLAIEARIVETWVKMPKDKDETSLLFSTPDEFERRGYHLRSRQVMLLPVFASDESSLGLIAEADGDVASNGRSKIVPCSWDPADDKPRFEHIFSALEEILASRK